MACSRRARDRASERVAARPMGSSRRPLGDPPPLVFAGRLTTAKDLDTALGAVGARRRRVSGRRRRRARTAPASSSCGTSSSSASASASSARPRATEVLGYLRGAEVDGPVVGLGELPARRRRGACARHAGGRDAGRRRAGDRRPTARTACSSRRATSPRLPPRSPRSSAIERCGRGCAPRPRPPSRSSGRTRSTDGSSGSSRLRRHEGRVSSSSGGPATGCRSPSRCAESGMRSADVLDLRVVASSSDRSDGDATFRLRRADAARRPAVLADAAAARAARGGGAGSPMRSSRRARSRRPPRSSRAPACR